MPGNQPLLSIIVAAHNSALTLPDTLQSLCSALDNDFSDCELLLINDASTDATPALLREFASNKPQARVCDLAFRNIGQVRQFAIEQSRGEYITMLDSDDHLKAHSLTEILHFLRQHTPDMLITKLQEVRDLAAADQHWYGLQPETLTTSEAITRFLIHKDFQAHLIGQFIRSDLLKRVSMPAYSCYEDFYVFPEVLTSAVRIHFSASSPYLYMKHEGSLSSTPSAEKINNLIACTERMDSLFGEPYRHLSLCHWIDIRLNQYRWISDEAQRQQVDERSWRRLSLSYFLDPQVRFSYKKKALKLLLKK